MYNAYVSVYNVCVCVYNDYVYVWSQFITNPAQIRLNTSDSIKITRLSREAIIPQTKIHYDYSGRLPVKSWTKLKLATCSKPHNNK